MEQSQAEPVQRTREQSAEPQVGFSGQGLRSVPDLG